MSPGDFVLPSRSAKYVSHGKRRLVRNVGLITILTTPDGVVLKIVEIATIVSISEKENW